jgi:hypothetical protein
MTATTAGWICPYCGHWEPVPPEGRVVDASGGECLAAQLLRAHDRLRTPFSTARAYEIPSAALALQWWRITRRPAPWWRRFAGPPPEGRVVNRSAEPALPAAGGGA